MAANSVQLSAEDVLRELAPLIKAAGRLKPEAVEESNRHASAVDSLASCGDWQPKRYASESSKSSEPSSHAARVLRTITEPISSSYLNKLRDSCAGDVSTPRFASFSLPSLQHSWGKVRAGSATFHSGQRPPQDGPSPEGDPLPLLELPDDVIDSIVVGLAKSDLKVAARLASTCRRLRTAYRTTLRRHPQWSLHVESEIATLRAKEHVVRRLTLTQHETYVRHEFVMQFGFGLMVLLLCCLLCAVQDGFCSLVDHLKNFTAFTFIHVMIHSVVLACAYRMSAAVGSRTAVVIGLGAILAYYVVLTGLVQYMTGIHQLPPHLNLEPWHRHERPFYPLAMIIWPFYGTSLHWRVIHVVSNTFAWCYGVYEWNQEYRIVREKNGLKCRRYWRS